MHILSTGVVPITSARSRLTEIAAEVVASGQPKVLTRNRERYVAVVSIADLDEYQRLRAADHMRNLHDLSRAAREIVEGNAMSVAAFRKQATALPMGVSPDGAATPRKMGVRRDQSR